MNIEDKCQWYQVSRDQRQTERGRGEEDVGTKNYEILGCYKCNGKNNKCNFYLTKIENENNK